MFNTSISPLVGRVFGAGTPRGDLCGPLRSRVKEGPRLTQHQQGSLLSLFFISIMNLG